MAVGLSWDPAISGFDPVTVGMLQSGSQAVAHPAMTTGTGTPGWMTGDASRSLATGDVQEATPPGMDLAGHAVKATESIGSGLKTLVTNPMFLPMLAMIGVSAAGAKRGGGGTAAAMLPMMMMMMQQQGGSGSPRPSYGTPQTPSTPTLPVAGGSTT